MFPGGIGAKLYDSLSVTFSSIVKSDDSDCAVTIREKVRTDCTGFANTLKNNIPLSRHFDVLAMIGVGQNRFFAAFRWLISCIPFVGSSLAGGDFRKTQDFYVKLLERIAADPPEDAEEVALADPQQVDQGSLSDARTIWCKGFEDGKFVLLVNGNYEVKVSSLSELRHCASLEEFSIDNYSGTNLNLAGITSKGIVIANCPSLETISASGCGSSTFEVKNCDALRSFTSGTMANSIHINGCQNFQSLDAATCVRLHEINLRDSNVPAGIILNEAAVPGYILDDLRRDHAATW
ncbi:MAG: hypothetical protein LBI34_02270 [Puniceicoccales bacterium]|jgi:hypothetical protein|nr:hypothetical protein [Puniceicoccales bacterium]